MRKLGLQLLGFIVGGLILWAAWANRDRGLLKDARERIGIEHRDTVIKVITDTLEARERVHVRDRIVYRDVVANPQSTKPEVIRACNAVILSCDAVRATNDTLRDSLNAQIKALRKMKEAKPPRLSAYGLAGYDWMNGAPIAQVGGDARILGPLSVTAFLEAAKAKTDEKVSVRGVAAVKFTFR